ncbi:MAG: response regulator transcription factor [Bdellovibrionales bacterium]
MNILVVEDQEDLCRLITKHFESVGFRAEAVHTGEDALECIVPDYYDVIVLDRGLPDMEGLELLESLRSGGVKTPILVLTAKDGLGDKVEGLNSGADDYLVKPFEMDELVARVHALRRRPSDAVNPVMTFGNVSFSPHEGFVMIDDKTVELSAKERDVLERLIRLPGRVVGKDTLLSALYGYGEEGSENSIEVVMHRLRKKLQDSKASIEIKTLRGIGYILKDASLAS